MLPWIPGFLVTDLLDVLVVAFFVWGALAWLRRSRARFALVGLVILGFVFVLARQLELQLTAWILQGFFAAFLLVVVVVFQEDLRRLFERIAVWGLRRRPVRVDDEPMARLVRCAAILAEQRTGALVVLPGSEPGGRHLEGGIQLDGELSVPLLLSLFDTSSPGHDGAVIVEGNRVRQFGVHLPLSTEHERLGAGGTRHAAALGISERTDALAIVVSEERGSISIALEGELHQLAGANELAARLERFQRRLRPPLGDRRVSTARLSVQGGRALISLSVALLFWLAVVPGSATVEVNRPAAVFVDNLPPGYELLSVEPAEVQVVLAGRRRDLLFADRGNLTVRVDALLVELGRRTFELGPANVRRPPGLTALSVDPARVRLSVRPPSGQAPP